jgi:hypothetical protein
MTPDDLESSRHPSDEGSAAALTAIGLYVRLPVGNPVLTSRVPPVTVSSWASVNSSTGIAMVCEPFFLVC